MALESWLLKVKTAISNGIETVRTTAAAAGREGRRGNVGVLAFEIAGLMSKLLQLWQALSDKSILWIRHEAIALEGVRKIVSNDDAFLLALACAEISESLRHVAASVARIGKKCDDPALRSFDRLFAVFADSAKDAHSWVLPRKEMESKAVKKMSRHVAAAARLHREIDEMVETEQSLRKLLVLATCSSTEMDQSPIRMKKISDLQQKLFWQKQGVRQLKESSLWNRSFDPVVLLLARSVFTVLARLKLVFGIGHGQELSPATVLPRSLSATVYPSENSTPTSSSSKFVSGGPLVNVEKICSNTSSSTNNDDINPADEAVVVDGFLSSNRKLLRPPPTTLGWAALAQHYANLIIVMEKMIRSPHLIGMDARDDLYGMLPERLRGALRARLRGVGPCASDAALAGEWREALARILDWLAPLAHNMIKWQSERSFEQQSVGRRSTASVAAGGNVLLLQTLFFANQDKTEAAITELLVGLNYIWRFEREMNAMALIVCSEFKGSLNHHPSR